MDISVELVGSRLLGILFVSAPLILFLVLFRVWGKEGIPLDRQEFCRKCLIISLIWFVLFLPALLSVFFDGKAAMPDRLRATSITFAVILILVLIWFF